MVIETTPQRITVMVADDHAIVREGIVSLLRSEPDLVVVGEAADGSEAVQIAQRLQPQVAVLDVSMPRLNGLTAARQIRRALPDVAVIILTVYNDHAYVAQALSSGVRGYVLKQSVAPELPEAIRAVHRREVYLSTEIADLISWYDRDASTVRGDQAALFDALSVREIQVLQLVAEGLSNKEIAQQLTISVKTIETHRARLMGKLNIHDTAGLVRYAIRRKIVQP